MVLFTHCIDCLSIEKNFYPYIMFLGTKTNQCCWQVIMTIFSHLIWLTKYKNDVTVWLCILAQLELSAVDWLNSEIFGLIYHVVAWSQFCTKGDGKIPWNINKVTLSSSETWCKLTCNQPTFKITSISNYTLIFNYLHTNTY